MFEIRAILNTQASVFPDPRSGCTEVMSRSCGPGGRSRGAWPLGQGAPSDTQQGQPVGTDCVGFFTHEI